ncbi:hypothetical protein BC827DRAFT_1241630 [Russula dissimulans]|nr:hypothetical protein BC827DRAFT_1241630 [Russula dissimulans]
MAPNQQTTIPSGSGSTEKSDKEELLKARTLRRAERAEARRVEAEIHKEAGNAYFREGDYPKAVLEYDAAMKIHGPRLAYLSNAAAAWLKMEVYDRAEACAEEALRQDPRFVKARYRRGLARKGNLELARAAVDFRTVLKQDPSLTEARDALSETLALMRELDDEYDVAVTDDESPLLDDKKFELESVSDSSDWHHEGNGIPCRFYNHDGCTRGIDCRYSHAPDEKSVRDRLGRNVCAYFLLGNCKFGGVVCVYCHDKTYLPPDSWWEDEGLRTDVYQISYCLGRGGGPVFIGHMFKTMEYRLPWRTPGIKDDFGPSHSQGQLETFDAAIEVGEALATRTNRGAGLSRPGGGRRGGRRRGRGKGRGGKRKVRPTRAIDFDDFDPDSEVEERMANFGFTEDEVMELLCQGVKPWDDDAWDVRDALYSL